MNRRISHWVALIVTVWMSVTMTKLKGIRPMHNQVSQFEEVGTKWGFLVAGSRGYSNYRHQADVCHAYQVLKSGGLKDENIIVMMYDDIAYNGENPWPGSISNKPDGPNVYLGIPKDYTGDDANLNNFFAVLSGDRSALIGGSGKVLNSGPNDTIFIYIAAHGGGGFITMQDNTLWGKDFVEALKKKHDSNSYKKMVIYLESCESGSMLEGLLPNDINIYATTSSSATEKSYAFYCPSPDDKFTACLGDVYSISWMEDSDTNDRTTETLEQQYYTVRDRTFKTYEDDLVAHVMQYGDINIGNEFLVKYLGAGPLNVKDNNNFNNSATQDHSYQQFNMTTRFVSQEDAHLLHLKLKLQKALDGSKDKLKAQTVLDVEVAHRKHVDQSVYLIWKLLFGEESGSTMMARLRSDGQPLVDDWDCLKMLIKTYEHSCGMLSTYGMKYSRAFANMCNAGISKKQMIAVTSQVCPEKNKIS